MHRYFFFMTKSIILNTNIHRHKSQNITMYDLLNFLKNSRSFLVLESQKCQK
jgi:hypothetical protein